MTHKSLDHLIKTYFNQDYDLIADTTEGLIADFLATSHPRTINSVRADIRSFLRKPADSIEAEFHKQYGFDFEPRLWGLTAEEFLRKIDSLLSPRTA